MAAPSTTSGMRPVSVLVVIVNYRTPRLALDAAGRAGGGDCAQRGDAHVVIGRQRIGRRIGGASSPRATRRRAAYRGWCTSLPEVRNGGLRGGQQCRLRLVYRCTKPACSRIMPGCSIPDTIAEPGALGALVDFLRDHPQGRHCRQPLPRTRRHGLATARSISPRHATELISAVAFGPVTRLLGNRVVAPPQPDIPAPADWVSGTSMMIQRDVLERVGPMDEGYFLYFEETDYCARAAAVGFGSWTVPASRVTHIGGQSTGVTGRGADAAGAPALLVRIARAFPDSGRLRRHRYATDQPVRGSSAIRSERLIEKLPGRQRDDPPHFWRDFLSAYYGPKGIMYRPKERARLTGDGRKDD